MIPPPPWAVSGVLAVNNKFHAEFWTTRRRVTNMCTSRRDQSSERPCQGRNHQQRTWLPLRTKIRGTSNPSQLSPLTMSAHIPFGFIHPYSSKGSAWGGGFTEGEYIVCFWVQSTSNSTTAVDCDRANRNPRSQLQWRQDLEKHSQWPSRALKNDGRLSRTSKPSRREYT